MGRKVDLDSPLSEEDKQYLIGRGRGYLIPANERRFGVDGTAEPAPGEEAGQPSVNTFYDSDIRDKAVYDVGGAPLPGTVLNHDTGRVYDRDNGVQVEFTGPGHTQSAHDLSAQRGEWADTDAEDGDIDQDIAEYVLDKKKTVSILKEKLEELKVEVSEDDKKQDLQEKLALKLQDDRDAGNELDLS